MLDTKIFGEAPRFDEKKDLREQVREMMEWQQKAAETMRYNLQILESRTGGGTK